MRAIVYLPYEYSEDKQYNVFYLMHGGWQPMRPPTWALRTSQMNSKTSWTTALPMERSAHDRGMSDL